MAVQVQGRTTLERAINKAMAQHTPAYLVDASTYTVPSSDGVSAYTVRIHRSPDGPDFTCTCKAGERGLVCYHIGAVLMDLADRRLSKASQARVVDHATAVLHTPARKALWA